MINVTIAGGNRFVWSVVWTALVSSFVSAACWSAFMLAAAITNLIRVIG